MQRRETTKTKNTSTNGVAVDRRKAKSNPSKSMEEKKSKEQPKSTSEKKLRSQELPKSTGEKKSKLQDQQKPTDEKKLSYNSKSTAKNGKATAPRSVKAVAEAKPSTERTKSKAAKDTTTIAPPISSVQPTKSSKSTVQAATRKNVPLKASHSIATTAIATRSTAIAMKSTAIAAKSTVSAKNVMNQVHNVTVSSPPPERRLLPENAIEREVLEPRIENGSRERTRTRTLGEDEIVLLKPTPVASEKIKYAIEPASKPPEIKPSVTFDVPISAQAKVLEPVKVQRIETAASGSDDEYEDDFESYESDFESDVSSGLDSSPDNTISTGDSSSDDNLVSTSSRHPFDRTGEPLEYNDLESDSFELRALPSQTKRVDSADSRNNLNSLPFVGGQTDSVIEIPSNTSGVGTSLQSQTSQIDSLDSPSLHGTRNTEHHQTEAAPKATHRKSNMAKRGEDLLRKITLDDMSFVVFDCKPIPYDLFMKIYGNSDTAQVAVQTHNNRIDQECQCDRTLQQTVWTQHPIAFNAAHINGRDFADYKRGCGRDKQIAGPIDSSDRNIGHIFDNCLRLIRNASTVANDGNGNNWSDFGTYDTATTIAAADINYAKLNRFLVESELTLSRIIDADVPTLTKSPLHPISDGYFTLDISAVDSLHAMKLHRLFVHRSLPGFLFTLHVDGAAGDLNVIAVWDLIAIKSPICLLSVWSHVRCVEIHPSLRNVIYAGLDDG